VSLQRICCLSAQGTIAHPMWVARAYDDHAEARMAEQVTTRAARHQSCMNTTELQVRRIRPASARDQHETQALHSAHEHAQCWPSYRRQIKHARISHQPHASGILSCRAGAARCTVHQHIAVLAPDDMPLLREREIPSADYPPPEIECDQNRVPQIRVCVRSRPEHTTASDTCDERCVERPCRIHDWLEEPTKFASRNRVDVTEEAALKS
jgi:hypothetical protein